MADVASLLPRWFRRLRLAPCQMCIGAAFDAYNDVAVPTDCEKIHKGFVMPAGSETAAPSAHTPTNQTRMTEGDNCNLCCEIVQRLLTATVAFEDSLRDEYVFDAESQEEWQTMLDWLAFALRQFLADGHSPFGKAPTTEYRKYGKFCDYKLRKAVAILKAEQEPMAAIFDALEHVVDARFALTLWRDKLVAAGAVRKRYNWGDASQMAELTATLNKRIEKLRHAAAAKNDLSICRHSRALYLYREFLFIVAPDSVAESRDAELIQLHKDAINVMDEGQAKAHTKVRLEKLQQRHATALSAPLLYKGEGSLVNTR